MIPKSTSLLSKTVFSVTLASAMIMVTGERDRARANVEPTDSNSRNSSLLVSLDFQAPNEDIPPHTNGGGVRGIVQFATPGEAAPKRVVGGGARGQVSFATPGEAAPTRRVGGASRGGVEFAPPGDSSVSNSAGGGVRGEVEFEVPGSNAPTQTASGGIRGEELSEMIPLMPTSNYGRTISGRPTFLVYVPPTASKEVFLSVQDASHHHHYQTTFQISGQGGIVELTLPDDAPELEMGKEYVWFLAPIAPDGILRPDNYTVTGWVKRVSAPIESDRLSSLTPIQLAALYAKKGIWYDTLQVLSAAKLAQPDDATLAGEWQDLLAQVGLSAIAREPIVEQL